MIMLSDLLRFKVTDKNNKSVPLADLSVALLDDDYPPITKLFFLNDEKKFMELDWGAAIENLDFNNGRIEVTDLGSALEISPEKMTSDVLLKHDMLDALIIDLLNRRVTRANDLVLKAEYNQLRLQGADVEFSAMLRRITGGIFNRINKNSLCDWKYVEFLRGDPQAVDNGAGYHLRINRLPAGEIAQLASYLPYLHAAELLTLLPDPKAADVLEAMTIERQVQIIEEFAEDEAVKLLALMSPDLAADLIRRLKTPTMKRFLEVMPKKQAERIIELLCYPEDSVGSVMVNDIIFIPVDLTVSQAREILRERLKEPDFVSLIFVVDDEKKRQLCGTISLRLLVTETDQCRIEDIMDPFIETLNPLDAPLPAAYRIVGGQLDAMPVTGSQGNLLGAMTLDAAITQIAPKTSEIQGVRIYS